MLSRRSAAALKPEELYGDPERVLWPLVGAGLQGALLFAPLVAAVSGIAVKPGFVKAAWYEEGAKLPPHRDQVQNLISISLVLSSTAGAVSSPRWPLRRAPSRAARPRRRARGRRVTSRAAPCEGATGAFILRVSRARCGGMML